VRLRLLSRSILRRSGEVKAAVEIKAAVKAKVNAKEVRGGQGCYQGRF
jgi:hypothetical protein